MLKVLFTGGGGAGTEALWRLYQQRYDVHFADAVLGNIHPMVLPGQCHEIPWASDPEYFTELRKLCNRLKIDLLIPAVDEELIILAKGVDKLTPTSLMLPNCRFVERMLDKLSMARSLLAYELPVPITHSLKDDYENFRFPCIVKPRWGRGSRGIRVLNSKAEVDELKNTLGNTSDDFVIQERIIGNEYTVQMVADKHGKLSAVVPVKVNIKRGITINAEVVAEPNVIRACSSIHRAIPTPGCYNIQLMLRSDGMVMPFEINPRISTTFCLVVAANIDPIAIFLGEEKSDDLLPFIEGVKLRRYWTNYFFDRS